MYRQSFLSVEGFYLEAIDSKLLQRAKLQLQLPEGMSNYDVYQQYPQIVYTFYHSLLLFIFVCLNVEAFSFFR